MGRESSASVRVTSRRTAREHSPLVAVRVAVLALAAAGAMALAGGRGAFWLCVPAALLACASSRTRIAAALSTFAIVAATAAPALAWSRLGPLPSAWLALLVPAASVMVLIAARERLERERDELRHFALSDPLTSVANRRSLLARAEYEIARHTRARRSFAVVMLDLDGFKLVNDRFGHAAGDDLLRDVAAGLKHLVRAQDTVARIGGDEFCVLAPETDRVGTDPLARRIAQAVGGAAAGVETVRASVGIAVFPDDGTSVTALLHAADERLLSAKRNRHRARGYRRAA